MPGILTVTEIKQYQQECREKLDKIDKKCRALNRDPNDEEKGEIAALTAEFDILDGQREDAEKVAAIRGKMDSPGNPTVPLATSSQDEPKDDGKCGFLDIREFLTEVIASTRAMTRGSSPDDRLKVLMAAGSDEQSTVSDPYGGFLIPEILLPQLLQVDPEADPTAGLVTTVPMGSPMVRIPARVDKNHTTSVTGGITVTFKSETQAGTETRTEFERVGLDAHTAMGLSYATEEILQDSPQSMAAILQTGMRQAWNDTMFEKKIRGTGVGEPEGVLNSPAIVAVTRTAKIGDDLVDMRAAAWRYRNRNTIWIANHDLVDDLASAHVSGTNGDIFLFRPGTTIPGTPTNPSLDIPDTLMGRPIFFSEYASAGAALGDIILVKWDEYLWGVRDTGRFAESMHVRFIEHENTFKFTARVDGRCWWRSVLTPKNGAINLSPVVTLAA